MTQKIVSGGQTGADRAALDVAIALGIATGGWVPRGRRAEDGAIPEKYTGLVETESARYEQRTGLNVRDSDATLVFTAGPPAGGTALTIGRARALGRPCLVVDVEQLAPGDAASQIRQWLAEHAPAVLNVAGPRQSSTPQIGAAVSKILKRALDSGHDG